MSDPHCPRVLRHGSPGVRPASDVEVVFWTALRELRQQLITMQSTIDALKRQLTDAGRT